MNFNSESKIWELISDSIEEPEMLFENIVQSVIKFMKEEKYFSGTPSELAERLAQYTSENISPMVLSKRLNQNMLELKDFGIDYKSKRSNGKRIICLKSVDSDGNSYIPITDTADPGGTSY